jgi:DNA-binding transcriptional LysR family regulator
VDLDLRFMDSEAACAAVAAGSLELAVVTLPPAPEPELELTPIWRDPIDFVVAPTHALARSPGLDPGRLAAQPAILPGRGTYTRELVMRPFRDRGLEPRVTLETNYLETNKMMTAVGLGWSALPRSMLGEGLSVLGMEGVVVERRLGLVRHRRRTLSAAARSFVAALEAVREEDA